MEQDNRTNFPRRSRSGGFTLIELLIVVGIMAVLSAVALPMVIKSIPTYKLRAEVRELAINFKKVRLEAVRRGYNVVIAFSDTELGGDFNGYQIYVDVDSNNLFDSDAGDLQLLSQPMRTGIVLEKASFQGGVKRVAFNPRGLPEGLGAMGGHCIVQTRDGSRAYRLTVRPGGNINIRDE